jgi:hypothetical protein
VTPHTDCPKTKKDPLCLAYSVTHVGSYNYLAFLSSTSTHFIVYEEQVIVLFCFEGKLSKTQWDHAASAYPAKATLSFAFTFSGTLPSNQSRTSYYTKIDPSSPPS